jgi:predicted nucleotidyltransferase/predicted transcriptional regulator with HTH domain
MSYLFNLDKSSLRAKVLVYFFTNPSARLYVREMAKILGVDATNLSKELSRLEKAGVFIAQTKGNQKYFSINEKCPFYSELVSIVLKTIGAEGGLRSLLAEVENIDCSFIYGSFADGTEHAESDIDLLIIGNPDEDKLLEKIELFEKELGREINYNVYSPVEFKKRLAAKDSFIVNVVSRKKIMLKGVIDGI